MIVYVSHPFPFGGKESAKEDVRRICQNDAENLPDVLFIPALTITCRDYDPTQYARDLGLLIELESRCDAVLMTGNWTASVGCRAEYEYAARNGIPVAENWPELLAIYYDWKKRK